MICTKCGARLMDTDQFCPKCGARVIKEKRCPDCGEILRDGVRFCPGCGRAVGESHKSQTAAKGTVDDIPIEAIERNILSETEAEIKAERRGQPASSKRQPDRSETSAGSAKRSRSADSADAVKKGRGEVSTGTAGRGRSAGGSSRAAEPARKKQTVSPEPPRRKKPVYREEDDWEYEDDWDDEDWDDDEEEGMDPITIMTVVVGCILLIVVAFLGFHFYRQYVPKDYEGAAGQGEEQEEEQEQTGQDASGGDGAESGGQEQTDGISGGTSKLTIVSNVNVRDQPSTSGTNVLKVAKAGETYVCNGSTEDGQWYEIVLEDGTTGYVFHEYIAIE